MTAEATLREVIGRLAPLERRAGSAGEREAAEWIVARLRQAGAREARIEPATFRDGYAPLIAKLSAAAAVAGAAALLSRRARATAAIAAFGAAAAIADDVSNGPRIARRLAEPPRPTENVVAEAGDRAPSGPSS